MKFLPLRAEETAVGGILHEGVFEYVRDLRRNATTEDQFGLDQLRKGIFEVSRIDAGDRRSQLMTELPPDDRPDLRHIANEPQPVEARHQRVAQRCRNVKWLKGSGKLVAIVRF